MQAVLTRLLETGATVVEVPVLDHLQVLAREMADVGIDVALHEPPASIDVKAVRERLKMSQEEFALWYGLDVATVRNWEQGRSQPDQTGRSMLWAIVQAPQVVRDGLDRVQGSGEPF